jgi:peptidoglycan/LPS O-acetylase OafA/YrhL
VGALPAELTGLALLVVTGAIYQAVFSKQNVYLPWVLLPQFFVVFAVGMGLALVAVLAPTREPVARVVDRVARYAGWGWLLAVALMVYSADRYGAYGLLPGGVRSRSVQLIGVGVAICMVLPALFAGQREGLVRRALSSAVLVWLGVLSYGIYLWHLPLIDLFWRDIVDVNPFDANPWTTLLFALVATTAVAAASWYGVERRVLGATERYRITGGRRLPAPRDR